MKLILELSFMKYVIIFVISDFINSKLILSGPAENHAKPDLCQVFVRFTISSPCVPLSLRRNARKREREPIRHS